MRRVRIADEADAPRLEIGEPAGIVVDAALQVDRERVDGEIAPQRIEAEIAAERHLSVAAVGLDVLAKRRDLDRQPRGHRSSPCHARARSARRENRRRARAPSPPRGAPSSRGRNRPAALPSARSRTVPPTRRVSSPPPSSNIMTLGERALAQQAHVAQASARQRAHSKCPCMSTPFSTWAGT